MLVFNPYFRLSVEECLAHPLFEKVRVPKRESCPKLNVVLDFEKEDDLNRDRLRQLILEEANEFR